MPTKNVADELVAALRDPRVADAISGAVSEKLRPFLDELAALRAENNAQAAKISKLESDLQKANSRVDELETYTRRDNLIISGLPVESYAEATSSTDQDGRGESSDGTEKSILKLFNDQLKVNVTPSDVSVAHRLRKRGGSSAANNGPPAVIVRFTNRKTRDRVYNARRELRNMSSRIFINEDLNQATNKIFFHARHLVKSRTIHSAWTYTGNVFIKETSASRPKRVTSTDELPPN